MSRLSPLRTKLQSATSASMSSVRLRSVEHVMFSMKTLYLSLAAFNSLSVTFLSLIHISVCTIFSTDLSSPGRFCMGSIIMASKASAIPRSPSSLSWVMVVCMLMVPACLWMKQCPCMQMRHARCRSGESLI